MIADRPLFIETADGIRLQGRLILPPGTRAGVVVCHPHPLYGGDMDNPVVGRIVTACAEAGLGTLRFNFRGVGQSTGRHGGGRAEEEDARAALDHLRGLAPAVGLAGYSFGAAVAARVAAGLPGVPLCLVAPPLGLHGDLLSPGLGEAAAPLLVVAGDRDEYCPAAALAGARERVPGAAITVLKGADHFLSSALGPLAEAVSAWAGAAFGIRGGAAGPAPRSRLTG